MKRYIASDFHVRNQVTDYGRVMDFLSLVDEDADEFLILGDWLELLWSNITILLSVSPYRDVIEKIKSIAARKPVKIVAGNHDWNLSLFASALAPIVIVPEFAENGVYYCHGHEFDWESFIIGTPVDPIWWSNALPFVLPLGFGFLLLNILLGREKDVYNWAIELIHERASRSARARGYHSVVFGHTHFPIVEVRDGISLYNAGDIIDSYSYLCQTNGQIELLGF
jgi:UDP-2,3-diacylglucosamine pyrophosphatase LpxH